MAKKLANTQFNLTQLTIKNLNVFKISAATKLVLIELSTHYNKEDNSKIVYPTMPYISKTLGIGLTTTKQAIQELEKNGLIIRSKRHKIYGNFNEYEFTDKFFSAVHFINLKEKRNDVIDYVLWREAIYNKFDGTCQLCGSKGGIMHAHHKKEYAKHPEKRYAIDNGILLCEKCHKKLHPWM